MTYDQRVLGKLCITTRIATAVFIFYQMDNWFATSSGNCGSFQYTGLYG